MIRRSPGALYLAVLLTSTSSVLAQTPPPSAPTAAAKADARARFDRGLALFEEGDNTGALAEFKRAYELIPNPVVLYNIGLVYAAMNRPAEATDALQKVVGEPSSISADHLARAKQTLAEQTARVAEIAVTSNVPASIEIDNVEMTKTPASAPLRVAGGAHLVGAVAPGYVPQRKEVTVAGGTKANVSFELVAMEGTLAHLALKTHLPGADVLIDGERAGRTPLSTSLTVAPGTHKIELRRQGYQAARQDLTLGDGASGEITLEPEEDKAALAEMGGLLALTVSETEALVTVDGKARGVYGAALRLPAGPHRLVIERGGFRTLERDVDVESGRTTTVPIVLQPTPETRQIYVTHAQSVRTWAWIGVGAGVALAGGGIGYLVTNSKSKDDALAERDAKVAQRDQKAGVCATMTATGNFEECNRQVDDAQSKLTSAKARDAIGYVGIGLGAAALGFGIVSLITGDDPHKYDPKPNSNELARSIVPIVAVAPGWGVMAVQGSF